MENKKKQNISKVYCSKCDLIFDSRQKFEKHLERHTSNYTCETCPIDVMIGKFVGIFRRKTDSNLE